MEVFEKTSPKHGDCAHDDDDDGDDDDNDDDNDNDDCNDSGVLVGADCGKLPEEWGVANVADLADLHKTDAETALKAYSNFVQAVYNTTIE